MVQATTTRVGLQRLRPKVTSPAQKAAYKPRDCACTTFLQGQRHREQSQGRGLRKGSRGASGMADLCLSCVSVSLWPRHCPVAIQDAAAEDSWPEGT